MPQIIASISLGLREEYEKASDADWKDSPFEWILRRPSRQRGKIGEQLISGWLAARGLDVTRSPDSDADRLIEGARVEVKFSTRWASGQYVFQQIRNQNYEYLICFGVSPFEVSAWIIRKDQIPFNLIKHQHGGERGRDTWWIGFGPKKVPVWLKSNGGLAAVYKVFSEHGKNARRKRV